MLGDFAIEGLLKLHAYPRFSIMVPCSSRNSMDRYYQSDGSMLPIVPAFLHVSIPAFPYLSQGRDLEPLNLGLEPLNWALEPLNQGVEPLIRAWNR